MDIYQELIQYPIYLDTILDEKELTKFLHCLDESMVRIIQKVVMHHQKMTKREIADILHSYRHQQSMRAWIDSHRSATYEELNSDQKESANEQKPPSRPRRRSKSGQAKPQSSDS